MKVLLISANRVRQPYPIYPIGLDYVAGAIKDRHDVRLLDMNQMGMDELKGVITEFSPELIGVSLRNIDNTDCADPKGFMNHYKRLVGTIKGIALVPVVLGGSGFTLFPERIMEALGADYGIIGEGERLSLLIECIENGRDPSLVPGVITPNHMEKTPRPWSGSITRSLDNMTYHSPYYLRRGGMLNIQTQRGCVFKCIYCTYPRIEGKKVRYFSPEKVAGMAKSLEDKGAKYLFITDSVFNGNEAHCLSIAKAFKRYGLSIPWGAFFAPKKTSPDFYEILADAGLKHVEFGTDALCNQTLSSYRKPFRVADVFSAHHAAKRANLNIAHYFIFGGPGENKETFEETLLNLNELDRSVLFFFCAMRIYPHTELYHQAVRENQIDIKQCLLEPFFYQSKEISFESVHQRIQEITQKRIHWIMGDGGEQSRRRVAFLYEKGYVGPLWDYLIK